MTENRHYAIGLGSNVGNRRRWLEQAVAMLDRSKDVDITATSALYESEPWGDTDQGAFLNAAVAARSPLPPDAFLTKLQEIEDLCGRQRDRKWGPRTLDLDLLAADDETIESERLRVPHPFIGARPFVYLPLAEIAIECAAWNELAAPDSEGRAIESQTQRLQIQPSIWGKIHEFDANSGIFLTTSEEETISLGGALANLLKPGDVLALNGPLGAGKSVIARAIARALGVTGPVPSPTFTLCRDYETDFGRFEHWDFYRLGSEDDLESTGFFDSASAEAIRVVEWAEMFPNALPVDTVELRLKTWDAESREMKFSGNGGRLPFVFSALSGDFRPGSAV